MVRRRTAAFLAVLTLGFALSSSAHAGTSDVVRCRDTVAKNGSKLAKTINKVLVGCHKTRLKTGNAVDCNVILPASDPKNKIGKIETKFRDQVGGAGDRCSGVGTPAALGYTGCPSPCAGTVPTIASFADVAECVICLTRASTEGLRFQGQGSPVPPLNPVDRKCHGELGKRQTKHYDTVLKERTRCQKLAEKAGGGLDTTSCQNSDDRGKISTIRAKGEAKISVVCAPPVDLLQLDSCSDSSLTGLKQCLFDGSDTRAEALFEQFYGLGGAGTTTTSTTTTSTTSTTAGASTTTTTVPGVQDAQCPDFALLRLFSRTGSQTCVNNGDCASAGNPGTCDTGIGRCVTGARLDTGWTGKAHGADVPEDTFIGASLLCPGPAPTCGQCNVVGIDPSPGNCRCSNDVRTKCTDPLNFDAASCGTGLSCTADADCKRCTGDTSVVCTVDTDCAGVGGTCTGGAPTLTCNTATGMCEGTCNCFLGSLLPLSSANVPACVINRLSADITGTTNVDTGDSDLKVRLRSIVFLGTEAFGKLGPCPVCGGTCTAGTVGIPCVQDSACDTTAGAGDGVCGNFDTVARDGLREGTCVGGDNEGRTCDVDGFSPTFPAFPGKNGGGVSLDCQPLNGKNISGTGLQIQLDPTTGTRTLGRDVDCGVPFTFPPFSQNNCHCRVCSGGGAEKIPCSSDAECAAVGAGTCSDNKGGVGPGPNDCNKDAANGGDGSVGLCVDADPSGPEPGVNGQCFSSADDDTFCDGVLRANGDPFVFCDTTPLLCTDTLLACASNADCNPGVECSPDTQCAADGLGKCTLSKRRSCFLDPIIAQGKADANAPVQAATFCIPPTINGGINGVAGLPGPGRALLQGTTEFHCAGSPSSIYTPGVGGCP